jgi:hypothetical protein
MGAKGKGKLYGSTLSQSFVELGKLSTTTFVLKKDFTLEFG